MFVPPSVFPALVNGLAFLSVIPMAHNSDSATSMPSQKKSTSRPSKDSEADSGVGVSAMEKRFAYSLLEKLLDYCDNASIHMTQNRPSSRFSRRESYSMATVDVKFFGKVRAYNNLIKLWEW